MKSEYSPHKIKVFISLFCCTAVSLMFFLSVYAKDEKDWKSVLQTVDFFKLEKFPAGLTNETYKYTMGDEAFAIRLGTPDIERLGINREKEFEFHTMGALLGVSPKIVYAEPLKGILITEFIKGSSLTSKTIRKGDLLVKAINILRKIHTITINEKRKVGQYYIQSIPTLLKNSYLKKAPLLQKIEEAYAYAKKVYERMPTEKPVLSHNDFFAKNLIYDGEKMWLIDWEYGDWSCPYNDLASLTVEDELTEEEIELILKAYFQEPTIRQRQYFKYTCALYRLYASVWCLSQSQKEKDSDKIKFLEAGVSRHLEGFWKDIKTFEREEMR